MTSLEDIRRAGGAGEPIVPLLDRREHLIAAAIEWQEDIQNRRGGTPIGVRERRLYKCIQHYKSALVEQP